MILRLSFVALLLALMLAPLGRMGMAEAYATPHHGAEMAPGMGMAGHCADMPMPAPDKPAKTAIDCAIACAAVAALDVVAPLPFVPARAAPQPPLSPTNFAGIHPEADPPPPRFS